MPHQNIIPQWQLEQQREMDRKLFEQNMKLANLYAWHAQNGPICERDVARARAALHINRAMAFSRGGGE